MYTDYSAVSDVLHIEISCHTYVLGYVLSLWQLHAYLVLKSDKTRANIVLLLVAKEKNYFRIETHKDLP